MLLVGIKISDWLLRSVGLGSIESKSKSFKHPPHESDSKQQSQNRYVLHPAAHAVWWKWVLFNEAGRHWTKRYCAIQVAYPPPQFLPLPISHPSSSPSSSFSYFLLPLLPIPSFFSFYPLHPYFLHHVYLTPLALTSLSLDYTRYATVDVFVTVTPKRRLRSVCDNERLASYPMAV